MMTTAPAAAPSHRARLGWRVSLRSARPVWVGAGAVVALLAIWQLLDVLGVLDAEVFPSPSQIGAAIADDLTQGQFWAALGDTLTSTGIGLVLATVVGIVAGVVYGTFPFVQRSTVVLIELLRPIPPVALLPVGLLLLGTSLQMKLTLITYTAFWPVFIQTAYGMRDIEPTALDMARVYRVTIRRRFAAIVLPSIGPYVAVGLRLSAVGALVASIVTELIGGASGLGYQLGIAQSGGQTAQMYAIIAVIGIIGLAINTLFGGLERVALRDNPAYRKAE